MPGLGSADEIGTNVFKFVEDDPFGQFSFIYLIIGRERICVVDSGSGCGHDLGPAVARFNPRRLPVTLVLTHVHFDHVGGVAGLRRHMESINVHVEVCMSSANQTFSRNLDINSLAAAHPGARVESFSVDRWLDDGSILFLSGEEDPTMALTILHTPGHTPDSLAIYLPSDNRLFAGDTVYPFTVVHLDCLGSSPRAFSATLRKLLRFVHDREATPQTFEHTSSASIVQGHDNISVTAANDRPACPNLHSDSSSHLSETTAATSRSAVEERSLLDFVTTIGMTEAEAERAFDVDAFLAINDWSPSQAIDMFFSSAISEVAAICPPHVHSATTAGLLGNSKEQLPPAVNQAATASPRPVGLDAVVISAGHVAASLPATPALKQLVDGLRPIARGIQGPSMRDGEYGEFQIGEFSIMLALKDVAQLSEGEPTDEFGRDLASSAPSLPPSDSRRATDSNVETLLSLTGGSVPVERVVQVLSECNGNVEVAASVLLAF